MALPGPGLVAPSPPRPGQDEFRYLSFRPYQTGEQPADGDVPGLGADPRDRLQVVAVLALLPAAVFGHCLYHLDGGGPDLLRFLGQEALCLLLVPCGHSALQPLRPVVCTWSPGRRPASGLGMLWSRSTSILFVLFDGVDLVRENLAHLVGGHAREPFQELVDGGSLAQVLQEGSNRHACAAEEPGAGYLAGVAFHRSR